MRSGEGRNLRGAGVGPGERRFVLGLESAGRLGGAAVAEVRPGEEPILRAEHLTSVEATHSERLMPALDAAMRAAGIDASQVAAVAVSVGPGSYTGVRIGVMSAKALAYAWCLPVVPVTTLEALAWQVPVAAEWVLPLLPARRGAFFGALYTAGQGDPAEWENLVPPGRWTPLELLGPLADPGRGGLFCPVGEGTASLCQWLHSAEGEPFRPRAAAVHWSLGHLRPASVALLGAVRWAAGRGQEPMTVEPLYLRATEAERRAATAAEDDGGTDGAADRGRG